MLTLHIVTSAGEHVTVDVQQVEFVIKCRHCGRTFRTIDPDRMYCKPSHRVRASEIRNIGITARTVIRQVQ